MDTLNRLIGFDPQLLADAFWMGLNVFILFFALSYLLFNPVRNVLEKRREKIAGDLAEAATEKQTAGELKAEYEAKLKEVSREAQSILDDARRKAKLQEAEIISQAKEEALRIRERAGHEIELERKKALDDMKQEMISIASLMAGKVVAANIDTRIQNALVDETLKEIGESTWLS